MGFDRVYLGPLISVQLCARLLFGCHMAFREVIQNQVTNIFS